MTTIIGLAELPSKDDPIEDPYFSIMELLIIFMMLPMILAFAAYYYCDYDEEEQTQTSTSLLYSSVAMAMLLMATTITSSVHAVVLMANRAIKDDGDWNWKDEEDKYDKIFSFKWPSVVYALDFLAWDWFFGWSMVFAGLAIHSKSTTNASRRENCRMEYALQLLLWTSGALSLVGLVAVPLDNIQVRMIGIVGMPL